jgi:hypothetical protein
MKLLGISSSKIASVAFLLVTLFLALALSSVDFLKTSNVAEVPVFYEGMDKKKEGMDKKKEGMDETEEEPDETEEEPDETEEEPDETDTVEGFEVGYQSLPFSSLAEAFSGLVEGNKDHPKKK